MNLNKFTKAELISKLNKTDSKKESNKISIINQINTYLSQIFKLILTFKNLIIKIALFSILIKYFRKIKTIKIITRIINYFFLSTFGIFITDIYGLKEIIDQIGYYWMRYVNFIHENKIYKIFIKVFNIISDENKSRIIENKSEVNKSEIIEDKSKILEKIDSKVVDSDLPSSGGELKNEKIMNDKTSEGNEKENWFQVNKYFWLGLSILSISLFYIYWDSIWGVNKDIDPDDGSTTTETPVFLDPDEEYEQYFKLISRNEELYDLEVIRSQNKGKIIEYTDVEKGNWENSPSTPKASFSKLPETDPVMLPISKK